MLIKSVSLLILLAIAVFISGCLDNGTKVDNPGSDVIPKTNLPTGFTYLGVHDIQMVIGGNPMNVTEGVYRYNGDEIYIQAIKNNDPSSLLSQYKEDLRKEYKSDFNPFEDIQLNGYEATKITDYSIIKGEQKARYSVVWANDKYMFLVGKSFDNNSLMALATATGN